MQCFKDSTIRESIKYVPYSAAFSDTPAMSIDHMLPTNTKVFAEGAIFVPPQLVDGPRPGKYSPREVLQPEFLSIAPEDICCTRSATIQSLPSNPQHLQTPPAFRLCCRASENHVLAWCCLAVPGLWPILFHSPGGVALFSSPPLSSHLVCVRALFIVANKGVCPPCCSFVYDMKVMFALQRSLRVPCFVSRR